MPIVTRLSSDTTADGPDHRAVTWVDIELSREEDRAWLTALDDVSAHAKQCLLDVTDEIV